MIYEASHYAILFLPDNSPLGPHILFRNPFSNTPRPQALLLDYPPILSLKLL
jgi:hypothetical protein